MFPVFVSIASLVLMGTPLQDPGPELVRRYVEAMQTQNVKRRNADVEVTIDARLPRLNRQATLRALRSVSDSGTITYRILESRGDSMVIREVIARYLAAESEEHKTAEIAITPIHYQFRLKRVVEEQDRRIYVFQLAPKKKRAGLFKGELWLDAQTALPVHEGGVFVKSPSIFIKRISFTRDFGTRDGLGSPARLHSTIESRIAGRVELNIHFGELNVD